MPRFAANLSLLFTERPFLDRFEAARAAGFAAVEFQFPYEHPADEVARARSACGLPLALFNVPVGDFMQGGDGLSGVPGCEAAFDDGLARAADYVARLRPRCVNVLPSRLAPGVSRGVAERTFARSLRATHARLGGATQIVVEALNLHDQPRMLFADHAELLAFLDREAPFVAVQYDAYHQARMGRDVVGDVRLDLRRIGHVQFADVPGRGPPGSGTLPLRAFFVALDDGGYAGFAGAEYVPAGATEASVGWLSEA